MALIFSGNSVKNRVKCHVQLTIIFSKNKRGRKATIIPKDPNATIGQRVMLSRMDCMKINSLYNCFEGDREHIRKIQMICAMVGI